MKRTMGVVLLAMCIEGVAFAQKTEKQPDHGKDNQPQKTPPAVSASPASLDFGDQVIRRASKPKRITVTNSGEKKLYINSVTVDGDNSEDFAIVHDTCTGQTIDSRKSCVVDVAFNPAQTGKRHGGLTLTDNATDSPQKLVLSGSGINSVDVPPTRPPE